MKKTTRNKTELSEKMYVNRSNLPMLLDCGMSTAVKIGEAAGAKRCIGRRVLFDVSKIKTYLDNMGGDAV